MPILYEPAKDAIYTVGDSETEVEHLDSCDINKMIKSASRGLTIRGGAEPDYGYDDTTMDAVQFRIQKQNLEEQLHQSALANEYLESELDQIPEHIRNKFKFRKKQDQSKVQKTNEPNDQKTDPQIPPAKTESKT